MLHFNIYLWKDIWNIALRLCFIDLSPGGQKWYICIFIPSKNMRMHNTSKIYLSVCLYFSLYIAMWSSEEYLLNVFSLSLWYCHRQWGTIDLLRACIGPTGEFVWNNKCLQLCYCFSNYHHLGVFGIPISLGMDSG